MVDDNMQTLLVVILAEVAINAANCFVLAKLIDLAAIGFLRTLHKTVGSTVFLTLLRYGEGHEVLKGADAAEVKRYKKVRQLRWISLALFAILTVQTWMRFQHFTS